MIANSTCASWYLAVFIAYLLMQAYEAYLRGKLSREWSRWALDGKTEPKGPLDWFFRPWRRIRELAVLPGLSQEVRRLLVCHRYAAIANFALIACVFGVPFILPTMCAA